MIDTALKFLFGELPKKDKAWFGNMYLERKEEQKLLLSKLYTSTQTGTNIGLVGRRSVGKTSFLRQLQYSKKLEELGFITKYVDLREVAVFDAGEPSYNELLLFLNQNIREYLEECDVKLPAFSNRQTEYFELRKHLKIVDSGQQKSSYKPLLLIIDDADYVPTESQIFLLQLLRPLFSFTTTTLLYAARPEAERTARGHFDSNLNAAFAQTEWIYLYTLDVRSLIQCRLKHLMRSSITKSLIRKLKSLYKTDITETTSEGVLFKEYPLTRRQEMLLDYSSNGNCDVILGMAKLLILYIRENQKKLLKHDDGGYIVGRSQIMEMFDIRKVQDSKHSILDIHRPKSRSKNPLYKNILELICIDGTTSKSFIENMKGLGHSSEKTVLGLQKCEEWDLIEPDYLSFHTPSGRQSTDRRMVVTPKGRYYLFYLSQTSHYTNRYGRVKGSIEVYKYGDRLTDYIIEYLRAIYIVAKFEQGFIKVHKRDFFVFFLEMFPDVIEKRTALKPETLALSIALDVEGFEAVLTGQLNLFSNARLKRGTINYKLSRNNIARILRSRYGELNFVNSQIPFLHLYAGFLKELNINIKPDFQKDEESEE